MKALPVVDVLDARRVDILRSSLGESGTRQVYRMYIDNGIQNLRDIEAALQQRDILEIHAQVHNLKGSSANLGFLVVHQWAIALEGLIKLGALDLARPIFDGLREAFAETPAAVEEQVEQVATSL